MIKRGKRHQACRKAPVIRRKLNASAEQTQAYQGLVSSDVLDVAEDSELIREIRENGDTQTQITE